MGRRGPQPVPTKVLAARGSWRADARKKHEPPAVGGIPKCPAWVKGAARKNFKQLVAWLDHMGMLSAADVYSITRLAVFWADFAEDTITLNEVGQNDVKYDKDGNQILSDRPEVGRRLKISAEMHKLERQFGLTPASRASIANAFIGSKDEDKKSSADAFLASNG